MEEFALNNDGDINFDCESIMEIYNECDYYSDDDVDVAVDNINAEWVIADNFEISVEIDPVDRECLRLAKEEVPYVLTKICNRIGEQDGRRRLDNDYTVNDFFSAWFTLELRIKLQLRIRKTVPDITVAEIGQFLQVELLLHFYRISATAFYSETTRHRYQHGQEYMGKIRYYKIIRAICGVGRSSSISNIETSSERWNAPYSINAEMQGIYAAFRNSFAEVAFLPGTTWVGLDDDLLRMRSRKVAESGYNHIHNPCKGMGIVQLTH